MKRSFFNDALARCIEDILDLPCFISKDQINRIVNAIELHGMTPPEYLPEPKYCEITGKQLECKPIREWENE